MKNYSMCNDLHKYAMFSKYRVIPKGTILLGDIIDRAGCKKSEVEQAEVDIDELILFHGHKYAIGNHEQRHDKIKSQYVEDRVLFTHGHLEFWGWKKSLKFFRKSPGKSTFMRYFVALINMSRGLIPFKISEAQKKRCMDRCIDYNCHTIVLGHKHPKEIKIILYTEGTRTIKIVVLPPGFHSMAL